MVWACPKRVGPSVTSPLPGKSPGLWAFHFNPSRKKDLATSKKIQPERIQAVFFVRWLYLFKQSLAYHPPTPFEGGQPSLSLKTK